MATTDWAQRSRQPALVLGVFLAAAWLAPLVSDRRLVLQSVLGLAVLATIVRSALRDRVTLSELGLRVDNHVASSCVLLLTIAPVVAGHALAGEPGFRWSSVPTYFAWALFQQFVVVAGAWRHFRPGTGSATSWRSELAAAALAAGVFAVVHAPNLVLMGLVFVAELTWLICFARYRNLFAVALVHALAAILVQGDLVPRCLPLDEGGPPLLDVIEGA